MYEVRLSPAAEKDLRALDALSRRRIIGSLVALLERGPNHEGLVALRGRYREQYRLRVGHYRIRLRYLSELQIFVVIRVLHRSQVYKH